MKKKLLSLALVLAMALTLLPTVALAVNCPTHTTTALSEVQGQAASCTQDGWKSYYTCSEADCSGKYYDEAGSEITNLETWKTTDQNSGGGKIAQTGHTAGSTYQKVDETDHAPVCTECSQPITASKANHTYPTSGGTSNGSTGHTLTCTASGCDATKTEAHNTSGNNGTCSVCGYDPNSTAKAISTVSATYDKTAKKLTVSWTAANLVAEDKLEIGITGTNAPTLTGNTNIAYDATSKEFTDVTLAVGASYTITVKVTGSNPAVSKEYTLKVSDDSTGAAKTITAVQAACNPAPATAGGAVTFVLGATVDGVSNSAAAAALEVTSVQWKLNGTSTVDATGTKNKAPSTPGLYSVAVSVALKAGSAGFTLADAAKVVQIGNLTVQGSGSGSTEDTTPPSTNDQGIPVASEVKNEKQADAAVEILKNTDTDGLAKDLMNSTAAASSFESLERAVKALKNINVVTETASTSLPSVVRSNTPAVTGAAFNASSSTVKLVVDVPSKSYDAASGYQISMTLTGVRSAASLDVPVILSLPLPSDVQSNRVVVLHYHGGSYPTVIYPSVSGGWLRFAVSGFSDFVITDRADIPSNVPTGGVYTTVNGGNRNQDDLSDVLPAIAAMLSGDGVFVDVPSTHWAAKEIRWARDGGLMSGYGNGNFGPTASTTRQQLWMVLARLSGTRPADMAMARQWAINTGVSDGSNPSGVLSRQQLVTMLYRFAKSQGKDVSASAKLSGYADSAKVASYAKEALSWAAAKGIISGSNGKLNPEGTATRAHFAVFLYRYSNG